MAAAKRTKAILFVIKNDYIQRRFIKRMTKNLFHRPMKNCAIISYALCNTKL